MYIHVYPNLDVEFPLSKEAKVLMMFISLVVFWGVGGMVGSFSISYWKLTIILFSFKPFHPMLTQQFTAVFIIFLVSISL